MDEPRSLEQRTADARAALEAVHADVWVATASEGGKAHLVPLSFAWDGARVILATGVSAATTRNLLATGRARLGFGTARDVVMMDARLVDHVRVREQGVDEAGEVAERYVAQADWDPRSSANDLVFLVLEPRRIQAWREANEIAGRTVMRGGAWLA